MSELVNGNNENEEKLIINIGEAYMPVVEGYERATESMFKPIYEKGRNLVKEICEAYSGKYSTNECKITSESYNNIIAFIGERGSGKTSSMLTFSNLLNDEEFLRSGLSKKGYDKDCIEFNFVQSDVIDPSQFDKNVNILEIILAGMFKNFKNKANKIESTDRQIIIEYFEKVYRNLKTLKKESSSIYDGEVLEALIEMSASMEIKENLSKLISVYLEKVEHENNEKSIFVVRIDDIDLNTKYAYDMVEQLRKYLMLPRIIILMALKMDQLHDVVNQTHYKSLAALSNMKNKDNSESCISINDKVVDMTEKYLSKLFPIDHRLLMPKLETFSDSKKFEIRTNPAEKGIEYTSLDYGIREIIYIKTGLHFIKHDKNENPIVPSNLRELVNFVHYLQKFEDAKITSKEQLIRCMNVIIKNESGKNILDDEIQKKLQITGNSLEDFSWLLDCPLDENFDDWKVLLKENKETIKLNLFEIDDNNFIEIYNKLRVEINRINEEEKERKHDNLDKKQLLKFKNYFLSYWCQNKISREGQLLITRFLELDTSKRNKFVILELEKIFGIAELLKAQTTNIGTDKIKKYVNNYMQIYTMFSNELNVSLGDVLLTLSTLEKLDISKDVSNIIFAIKTIYYIELECLNLSKVKFDKQLPQDIAYLIGGEYFSDSQKKIISDEKGDTSRTVRECKIFKIQDEIKNLEDNHKLPTMFFMNLMFKRAGKINDNYRTDDNIYYDFCGKLQENYQKNYVLSITSPFFNSHRGYEFINSTIYNEYRSEDVQLFNDKIIQEEKCISNVILLEYLFIEKFKVKNEKFTNREKITSCWHEFYEDLHSRVRFFDGISYFSIFNMNFMRVFRRAKIQVIDIIEEKHIIEKLIEDMVKRSKRQNLFNYWNDVYTEVKKNSKNLEIQKLNQLNKIIQETYFFKINKSNTATRFKEELIDILQYILLNESEDISEKFKEKDDEWLENNKKSKSLYINECIYEAGNHYNEGNYDEAIAYYSILTDLEPDKAKYWNDLGDSYYYRENEGDYNEAIKAYNKAVKLNPKEAKYWNNLGDSYYYRENEGDYNEAIKAYNKAVKLNPKEANYWNNLGLSYYYRKNEGDYNEAIKAHETAVKSDSKEAMYWDSLGDDYYARKNEGDLEKAIEYYETALKQKNIETDVIEDINKKLSKCREELNSIESQTEEPQETNLENSEPKDNE